MVQCLDKSGFVAIGWARNFADLSASQWDGPSNGFLAYNPQPGSMENTFSNCSLIPTTGRRHQIIVTKVDNDGNILWSYLYGYSDYNSQNYDLLLKRGEGLDIVPYAQGGGYKYRCVGAVEESVGGAAGRKIFMFDINDDGDPKLENNLQKGNFFWKF